MGLAPLVGNIGEYAEVVNIPREWMQEPANLFLSPIFVKLIIMKTCRGKNPGQYAQPTGLPFCCKCRDEEFTVVCFSPFTLGKLTRGFFLGLFYNILSLNHKESEKIGFPEHLVSNKEKQKIRQLLFL